MRRFLRTYWIWLLAPAVLLALLVLAAWLFTDEEGAAPFRYALY